MSSPPTDPNITPALQPPPGVKSNLVNPSSRGYVTIIVFALYMSVTTPLVCVRMYVRRYINKRVWWDDWTCVLGWVGLVVLTGFFIKSVEYGNGTDQWNVSIAHLLLFIKLIQKMEIVAIVTVFFTKLSILLLFIRIFVPPLQKKPNIFYAIWAIIWLNLLYSIGILLMLALQCVGKTAAPGQTCVDHFGFYITSSVVSVLTDVVMLAIPLVAIWGLQLAMRRKIGICAIFAMGAAALGASLVRLAWQFRHVQEPNRTTVIHKLILLGIAEQAIGLVVTCLPVTPAFFRHIKSQRDASSTAKESWKPSLGSNSLSYRAAGRPPRGSTKDPYLLSSDYKELDDLESANCTLQPALAIDIDVVKGGSTTTTVIDSGGTSGDGRDRRREVAEGGELLVSRSVHVESHPIGKGPAVNVMLPAHLKR